MQDPRNSGSSDDALNRQDQPFAPKQNSSRRESTPRWQHIVGNIATVTALGIAAIRGDASQLQHSKNNKAPIHDVGGSQKGSKTLAPVILLDPNKLLEVVQNTEPHKHGTPVGRDVYTEVMYNIVQKPSIPHTREILLLIAEKDPYKIIGFDADIRFGKNAEAAELFTEVTKKALEVLRKKDPEYLKWALRHHDYSVILNDENSGRQ